MKSFKDFILESIIEKVIKFAKSTTKEKFLEMAKRGKIGGQTISEMLTYMDSNSTGKLDLGEIRKELNEASPEGIFYLYKIDTKELKIQDLSLVKKENKEFKGEKSNSPIIVGKDYFVIDGRHRSADTKGFIDAYLPANIFYDEIN